RLSESDCPPGACARSRLRARGERESKEPARGRPVPTGAGTLERAALEAEDARKESWANGAAQLHRHGGADRRPPPLAGRSEYRACLSPNHEPRTEDQRGA